MMEGLIPMVYKAIKKNKTRRQYECLSSGAARSYNTAEFFINDKRNDMFMTPSSDNIADRKPSHRRYKSVEDFSGHFSTVDRRKSVGEPQQKQLVRFRSQRLFSCVSGAT